MAPLTLLPSRDNSSMTMPNRNTPAVTLLGWMLMSGAFGVKPDAATICAPQPPPASVTLSLLTLSVVLMRYVPAGKLIRPAPLPVVLLVGGAALVLGAKVVSVTVPPLVTLVGALPDETR